MTLKSNPWRKETSKLRTTWLLGKGILLFFLVICLTKNPIKVNTPVRLIKRQE